MQRVLTAVIVRLVDDVRDIHACLAVREQVFQKEQGISRREDRDGYDFDVRGTFHLAAITRLNTESPLRTIGTLRGWLLADKPDTVKLERMAVLAEFRGHEIGSALLLRFETEARKRKRFKIILHAQEEARHFYERHGFKTTGSAFLEAGKFHYPMIKVIGQPS